MSYILRIASIAGKYATYPKNQWKQLWCCYNTKTNLEREFALAAWVKQSPKIIHLEIRNSISRLDLDEALQYLAFFRQPLTEEYTNEFEEIQKMDCCNEDCKYPITKEIEWGNKKIYYYHSKYIFNYLINYYNNNYITYKKKIVIALVIFIFTLIKISAIYWIKYIWFPKIFKVNSWFCMCSIGYVTFIMIQFFAVTYIFITMAIIDLDRVNFI